MRRCRKANLGQASVVYPGIKDWMPAIMATRPTAAIRQYSNRLRASISVSPTACIWLFPPMQLMAIWIPRFIDNKMPPYMSRRPDWLRKSHTAQQIRRGLCGAHDCPPSGRFEANPALMASAFRFGRLRLALARTQPQRAPATISGCPSPRLSLHDDRHGAEQLG
jgi:hypothetical protein